jgi:hypothetical protein
VSTRYRRTGAIIQIQINAPLVKVDVSIFLPSLSDCITTWNLPRHGVLECCRENKTSVFLADIPTITDITPLLWSNSWAAINHTSGNISALHLVAIIYLRTSTYVSHGTAYVCAA